MCLQSASSPEVTENKKPLFFPSQWRDSKTSSAVHPETLLTCTSLRVFQQWQICIWSSSAMVSYRCRPVKEQRPGCCQRCQSLWGYYMLLHAPHHQANLHLLQCSISIAASCLCFAPSNRVYNDFLPIRKCRVGISGTCQSWLRWAVWLS